MKIACSVDIKALWNHTVQSTTSDDVVLKIVGHALSEVVPFPISGDARQTHEFQC